MYAFVSEFPRRAPGRPVTERPRVKHPKPRNRRRIDGRILFVDLNSNVVVAWPGGTTRVKPTVAEFIQALLDRHPKPASHQRLIKAIYPTQGTRPRHVLSAMRLWATRSRLALEPLGFTIESVPVENAEGVPCAYRLARMPA